MTFVHDYINAYRNAPTAYQPPLKVALEHEAQYRELFAQQPDHPQLKDKHLSLLNVYKHASMWKIRHIASVEEDPTIVMPVQEAEEGKLLKPGDDAIVPDLGAFRRNWNAFTESSLAHLNWDNMFAAGGAVAACLLPVPEKHGQSVRSIRKWFHEMAYASSDVDLFIYGLDEAQARKKMEEVYSQVADNIPWEVLCVRSKNAITLVSQYPYRHIQIILRLYKSPAEILMGFDVDCCSVGFDGANVWSLPRTHEAFVSRCNRVDLSRRSPSYEMRLAKYAARGFQVHVPGFERKLVDPMIFERTFEKLHGLARLLVLESLSYPEDRYTYLEKAREDRLRPRHPKSGAYRRQANRHGDLKAESGMENSEYETVHIPYGPKWQARRIVKMLYTKDMVLNSEWYPANHGKKPTFHRHPAFFGTMTQVLEDCCGNCPDVTALSPKDAPDAKEADLYVSGPVTFMVQNPGQQRVGSFNPLEPDDYAEGAYVVNSDLFEAIARQDTSAVEAILQASTDADILSKRDHFGRTPLHLAVMCGHADVVRILLDNKAKLTSRLPDGRAAWHIAADGGHAEIVRMLLHANEVNKSAKQDREQEPEKEELDASMVVVQADNLSEVSSALEEAEVEDDILDIDTPEWDYQMTGLERSILFGHGKCMQLFLEYGANVRRPIVAKKNRPTHYYEKTTVHTPLSLCMACPDSTVGLSMAKFLLEQGATCTSIDGKLRTFLHVAVNMGNMVFVKLFLEKDPKAKRVLNKLDVDRQSPVAAACARSDSAMVELLLQHGALVEEYLEAATKQGGYVYIPDRDPVALLATIRQPVCSILKHDVCKTLIQKGADVNSRFPGTWSVDEMTLVDHVRKEIQKLETELEKKHDTRQRLEQRYREAPKDSYMRFWLSNEIMASTQGDQGSDKARKKRQEDTALLEHYRSLLVFLVEHGGKTLNQIKMETDELPSDVFKQRNLVVNREEDEVPMPKFSLMKNAYGGYSQGFVFAESQQPLYMDLFEAVWKGDVRTFETLTMRAEKPLFAAAIDSNEVSLLDMACLKGHTALVKRIIEIADDQYKSPAETQTSERVSNFSIMKHMDAADADSDEYSDYSYSSDEDHSQKDEFTVDKPHATLCKVHPFSLVMRERDWYRNQVLPVSWWQKKDAAQDKIKLRAPDVAAIKGHKKVFVTLFKVIGSIRNNALVSKEAYDVTYNIVVGWPKTYRRFKTCPLTWAIAMDNVELVDYFVKHAAGGVDFRALKKDEKEEDTLQRLKDSNVYLGLNIDGGKKVKWIKEHDSDSGTDIPLLHNAALYAARNVMTYILNGEAAKSLIKFANKYPQDARSLAMTNSVDGMETVAKRTFETTMHNGATPLHWAILGNHPTVIHLMHQAYKHKGDTRNFMQLVNHNLKPKKDRVAERPLLLYALFKESLASFEQLLEVGADPHVRDKDGKNALFYATLYLSDKEFDAFCDRHVHLYKHTLSEMEYENKNTLLTCAISENQLHKFSRILGMTGVDVFQRDGKHNLPVHRVVMNAYEEMVRLLVPHGGLTMENGIGMTPVELARAVWLVEFNNSDYSAKELVVDGEESEEEESDDSEEEEDEEKNKADTVNRLAVLRQFPPVSQARLLTPSNKLYWIAKSTATLLSRTTRATPKPTYANFSTNAIHPK